MSEIPWSQWHPTKNGVLNPDDVTPGSTKKVWWVCDLGHEWEMRVQDRTLKGSGCSVCSGKKVLEGFNDLASQRPDIAKFWNYEKNGDLLPSHITTGSQKRIWFKCQLDSRHTWEGRVTELRRGRGCPVCSNRRIIVGVNDLVTTHPDLASEWHPHLNQDLGASQVGGGSHKRAWWVCSRDSRHFWQASIESRAGKRALSCPVCANRLVIAGVNDLATTHPRLAREWDEDKNGKAASEIAVGSHQIYFWKCSNGHSWKARIYSRMTSGCPVCKNKAVKAGVNDLATTHRDLLELWDFERNQILPTELVAGSAKNVFWICRYGHSYSRAPVTMLRSSACPYCSNTLVMPGFNDLETMLPDLATEWNLEKNGDLRPSDVIPGSDLAVWWTCVRGHSWKARIANRKNGRACPRCAQVGFDQTKPGITYFITNSSLQASKVGVTNVDSKKDRLQEFRDNGWRVVYTVTNEGYICQALETRLLRWIRKELGLPPYLGKQEMPRTGGWSETFEAQAVEEHEVIAKMQENLRALLN